jgi:signal transduction histidine kinase/ligand-binding sensor domain-containing protein
MNSIEQRMVQVSLYLILLDPLRKACLLVCCLVAGALCASSASAQYRFDTWTADGGLPQNSVYAIVQTRDGYLWFTTLDGLVRYDGVRFKVFDKGNTKGIGSNRFNRLFEDGRGNLWAGTEDGGLLLYHDGEFTTYTTTDGLPSNWVINIQSEPGGYILIQTTGGGVRWKDGRFTAYEPAPGQVGNRYVYIDRSGGRWFCDRSGLHRVRDGSVITYRVPDLTYSASYGITCMHEDRQGCLWIGANSGEVIRVKDGGIALYGGRDGLPRSAIETIYCDRQGSMWFGTGAGVIRFQDGIFSRFTTADGLSSNFIRAICEDREGSIWIGTADRGLNRLSKRIVTVYSARDGLEDDNVYPVLEDRAGRVWIGSLGLTKFENGVFTRYTKKDGLPSNTVQSLYEDDGGRLWIGCIGGVVSFKDGKFVDFTPTLNHVFNNVWDIHEDRRGSFWFATDNGLVKVKDGVRTIYKSPEPSLDNDVKVIHEDHSGRLWFGTYGGLAFLRDDKLAYYTSKDGLASDTVRAIYEDGDGTLWIGTYDGGLSRLKDGRCTNYTTDQGLYNNGAFQILEDSRGNFWISCNRGIYHVSKQELNDYADGKVAAVTSVAYGKQDGMINIECNGGRQPAGFKARDGKLWFPTQQGVAVIDPETIPVNSNPPIVVIEACLLDRASVDFSGTVEIAPGKQDLEITYTGLSFIKSELIRFKYRLEGLDPDWIEAGTRRTAYYSRLPPGSYRFLLIAANSDGIWNREGARLHINVYPPFWNTWWFLMLAAMSVVGLALLVYKGRVSRLEKARGAQEAFSRQLISSQETERKRIAAELHDGLGQNLLIIKNRALIALKKREETAAQTQLEEISTTVSHAIEEVRSIARNLRPLQLDRLGLTQAIKSIVTNVSNSSAISFGSEIDPIDGLFSAESEINLYRIVQEGINNIVKHSGATEALVAIRREEQAIQLVIQDNGRGFNTEAAPDANGGGFGLAGIGERARMLGGRASFHSAPGKGTTVSVRLDLPGERKGRRENGSEAR